MLLQGHRQLKLSCGILPDPDSLSLLDRQQMLPASSELVCHVLHGDA